MRVFKSEQELAHDPDFASAAVDMHNARITLMPDAILRIGTGVRLFGANLLVKSGARVEIGDGCLLRGQMIAEEEGSISIGKSLVMTEPGKIRSVEGGAIRIGANCLFSSTTIYSGDYHGLYDGESGERINPPADVSIGNRVWIALGAMILKGCSIGDGSVVGAGAVVSGAFAPRVAVAGNPARVIRENVLWSPRPHDVHPSKSG